MKKHQGTIIAPSGLNISAHEMDAARAVADCGLDVEFRAQSKGKRVKNADFVAGGVLWEVKSPTSDKLKVVEKRLREAVHQSRDIIFDSRRMRRLTDQQVQGEVDKWAHSLQHVRRLLYINRAGEVIKIK
ncbi:hypothetical protein [uncultured Adlercreutzia sp.]|uniref:CdiA C-terminal domain-containing protein n=1 Tax=uncultured Adlercreutzia sp. TaxID=875803 RepID=UPI0026F3ADF5|nr:hypothetical protein [uncultured Adlercreutzia sp.]